MRAPPPRKSRWRTAEVLTAEAGGNSPGAVFTGIEVVWRVARCALEAHAPHGSSRVVELAVRLECLKDGVAIGSAWARDGAASRLLETFERVPAEVIPDIRGEVHVECPGVLHATVAPADGEGGGWRLVYARSPLLDAMGVPGGRAEAVGVRVV